MSKRLSLLNGLAILFVVCNHAAWRGIIAMFWWTDQYRPVTTPNYDQFGTLAHHVLKAIVRVSWFSIPAFLFVSGFFMVYASRGARLGATWKAARVRVVNLLVPYLIWSVVCFIGDALEGTVYTPVGYLKRLALGEADESYYFVPLICQFYLLSPLLVSAAKARARLLLFLSTLVQLAAVGLRYLDICGVQGRTLDLMIRLTPSWSFARWALFFTLGLVCSFHIGQFRSWLARFKKPIAVATVVFFLLTALEAELVYGITGREWESPFSLPASMFALASISFLLTLDRVPLWLSKALNQLGRRSYGIYLLHNRALQFFARLIRKVAPWILAYQATLFTPLLVGLALGVSLLFMNAVAKSPARRSYRYLFG